MFLTKKEKAKLIVVLHEINNVIENITNTVVRKQGGTELATELLSKTKLIESKLIELELKK